MFDASHPALLRTAGGQVGPCSQAGCWPLHTKVQIHGRRHHSGCTAHVADPLTRLWLEHRNAPDWLAHIRLRHPVHRSLNGATAGQPATKRLLPWLFLAPGVGCSLKISRASILAPPFPSLTLTSGNHHHQRSPSPPALFYVQACTRPSACLSDSFLFQSCQIPAPRPILFALSPPDCTDRDFTRRAAATLGGFSDSTPRPPPRACHPTTDSETHQALAAYYLRSRQADTRACGLSLNTTHPLFLKLALSANSTRWSASSTRLSTRFSASGSGSAGALAPPRRLVAFRRSPMLRATRPSPRLPRAVA